MLGKPLAATLAGTFLLFSLPGAGAAIAQAMNGRQLPDRPTVEIGY